MNEQELPTWRDSWDKAQDWESGWWDECLLTFGEEQKQVTYADRMGLVPREDHEGRWPTYDLEGRSVVDIGGGPCSMLLKAANPGRRAVIDPCSFPEWVRQRYLAAGIDYEQVAGEDFLAARRGFNEAWLYNVLQHVLNPQSVVERAQRSAGTIRVFEWLHTDRNVGHLHAFTREDLDGYFKPDDDWAGSSAIEVLTGENRLYGTAYYGVFTAT